MGWRSFCRCSGWLQRHEDQPYHNEDSVSGAIVPFWYWLATTGLGLSTNTCFFMRRKRAVCSTDSDFCLRQGHEYPKYTNFVRAPILTATRGRGAHACPPHPHHHGCQGKAQAHRSRGIVGGGVGARPPRGGAWPLLSASAVVGGKPRASPASEVARKAHRGRKAVDSQSSEYGEGPSGTCQTGRGSGRGRGGVHLDGGAGAAA